MPHPPSADRALLRRTAVTMLALGATTVAGATVYLVAFGIATPGEALLWQGATYAAWVPLAVVLAWAVERGERTGRPWSRPWAVRLLAFPPLTLLHALASAAVTWLVREAPLAGRAPSADYVARHVARELPVEILQYWAVAAVLIVVETRRRLRERERAAARLEAELGRAQLAALKARLQPHFLFNTLQSIALLIPREPDVARRMTVHLGDELALVRAYLDIEAQRFRDRLTVRWCVDGAPADAPVPDLLLQPLVENALRHGLWPRPGRGTLTVRAGVRGARLLLAVEDDGAGLPAGWVDGARDGTGLGATRARLLALYGDAAALRVERAAGGGTVTTVALPLRTGDHASRLLGAAATVDAPPHAPVRAVAS